MSKESLQARDSMFRSATRAVGSYFRHRFRKQASAEMTESEAHCATIADAPIISDNAEAEIQAMSDAPVPAFAAEPVEEFSEAALNVAPPSWLEEAEDESDILELPPILASMLSSTSMDILKETGTGTDAQIAACFADGATLLDNSYVLEVAVLDFATT